MTSLMMVGIVAVVLIVWDVYIMWKKGGDATISWGIYSLSQRYPTLPFAFGYMMAHFFGGQNGVGCK